MYLIFTFLHEERELKGNMFQGKATRHLLDQREKLHYHKNI